MDCREVVRFLHAYLDGEFDEQERVSFGAHLESCAACQAMAHGEKLFRRKAMEHYRPEPAPAWLEQRVKRALRDVEPSGARSIVWRWSWLVPVTAAAAVLAVVVIGLLGRRTSTESSLVAESVAWHRRNLPMDVSGPSPEMVRQFFVDKVPFAVRPPAMNQYHTRLVGGRLSNLKEHQAAYLIYNVGSQRVSVFIFDSNALVPSDRGGRLVHGDVQWHNLKGYNVGLFVSGGTGYAVTSEMDPRRLIQFVNHTR